MMGGSHRPSESMGKQQQQQKQQQHVLSDPGKHKHDASATATATSLADSSPPGDFVSAWAARSTTPWHRYIRTPLTQTLRPAGIVGGWTEGRVKNEEALLGDDDDDEKVMVLERRRGEVAPAVVVDFGLNAVGTVEVDFGGSELFDEGGRSDDDGGDDDGDDGDDDGDDDDGDDDDGDDSGDDGTDDDEGDLQVNGQEKEGKKKKKHHKKKGKKRNKHTRPGIRLAFSESLEFLSDRSDFTRSDNGETITPGTDQIAVPAGASTWTNVRGASCPKGKICADGLHGFRYMRIALDALRRDRPWTSRHGRVAIRAVRLKLSCYHGTPDTFAGWFECSDVGLTQCWYDAVYTNDLCVDVFRREDTEPRDGWSESLDGKLVVHDAPKRDRDPYAGDLGVAGPTAYYARGPDMWAAVRNVLVDLALHQRDDGWIPPASIFKYKLNLIDYPLWWVTSSYDLLMHTNDVAYVRAHYSNLLSVLDDFYPSITNPATELVERHSHHPPFFGLSDDDKDDKDDDKDDKGDDKDGDKDDDKDGRKSNPCRWGDYAFVNRMGPVTYYNVLYVRALRQGAAMARELDRLVDAHRWEDRAKRVAHAVAERNWDADVGAFFDGTTLGSSKQKDRFDERYVPTHALDGNSLAILEGIVPARTARGILSYFSREASTPYGTAFYDNNELQSGFGERVYAFISFFELQARFEAMMPSAAVGGMRTLWGWMARHDPGVTAWEGLGRRYVSGFTSRAHGWSTGIVALCSAYVLGVRPTRPGFGEWEVKPRVGGGLRWARGGVPVLVSGSLSGGDGQGDDKYSGKDELAQIQVSWEVPSREVLSSGADSTILAVRVTAPSATKGTISVPTKFCGLFEEDDDNEDALFDATTDWDGVRVFVDNVLVVDMVGKENVTQVGEGGAVAGWSLGEEDGFVSVSVVPDGREVIVRVERADLEGVRARWREVSEVR